MRARFQREPNVCIRGEPRGPEAKKKIRDQREAKRECEHPAVERDLLQPRHARRAERDDGIAPPERDQESQKAAEQGDEHALDQELANDLSAIRAQRRAHREFPRPPGAAHGEKVREISAGNQQDQSNRAEQEPKVFLVRANLIFEKRRDVDAIMTPMTRILLILTMAAALAGCGVVAAPVRVTSAAGTLMSEHVTQDSGITLTGLGSGTAVNISVTARNAAGESQPTAPVSATVP